MTSLVLLRNSTRTRDLTQTLSIAADEAARVGVTRTTDITRLDRIGVPVFAAIRPNAQPGSLCVHSGKSSDRTEARVGALMEAIEYAWAEPGRSRVPVFTVAAQDIPASLGEDRELLLAFCPRLEVSLDVEARTPVTEARDLLTERTAFVPAELVFLPFTPRAGEACWFEPSSNGLCSGNSLEEAVLHGILELIERDIASLMLVSDSSTLVESATLPRGVAGLVEAARDAGLDIWIRTTTNDFELPFFLAVVAEGGERDPALVCAGYGCHWSREIALHRAVTEAIQSRLTFIHGGRDDLEERHGYLDRLAPQMRQEYARRLVARASSASSSVGADSVRDALPASVPHDQARELLFERLARVGARHVLVVELTPHSHPLSVARVVIPGLEHFVPNRPRAGPRLARHVLAYG